MIVGMEESMAATPQIFVCVLPSLSSQVAKIFSNMFILGVNFTNNSFFIKKKCKIGAVKIYSKNNMVIKIYIYISYLTKISEKIRYNIHEFFKEIVDLTHDLLQFKFGHSRI